MVSADIVVTADLTDAKRERLIGDHFDPAFGSWKDEHSDCIN